MTDIVPIIALVVSVVVPLITIGVAIARGFARMEVRFTEIGAEISRHAIDLLRIESDLRADLQEIRIALTGNHADHETRIREIEKYFFRVRIDNKNE